MTKDKFLSYLMVQESGLVNMFAILQVIKFAKAFASTILTKSDCIDIMKNYNQYKKDFCIK